MLESASLDTDGAVARLKELAGKGPVLELGVGTGRVALPLAEEGLEVHGIEASKAMIAKLREKPGGEAIQIMEGDFADVETSATYSMVFAVYNTFSALLDQERQIRCLANVAKKLLPGACLVLECAVPDHQRLAKEQDVQVRYVDADLLVLHASRYDSVQQMAVGQSIIVANGSIHSFPAQARYTWPSELDLMARLAGLQREHRWGGWHQEKFNSASESYVTVYRKKS